ncbi:hypothetical protein [Actinomyces weissii]|uniref:Uncharacterized protein n=1 Tax=Actinomyces weissii TaxID=675090 RepID=A0A7T7S2R4_9ACTO|nr:hypothetical protein [Actinomyces weissii]QQM67724.1 hypothetical protein JG540_02250 [Actinomyces weissii]
MPAPAPVPVGTPLPAPGQAPVAAQAPVGTPATDPFSLAFRPLAAVPAQLTVLFSLLTVLGAALLSGILLAVGTSQLGEEEPQVNMLPVALGMSLSGRLSITGQAFLGDAQVNLSILALGTLTLIGTVLFQLARRRRHLDGAWAPVGAVALRSCVEALAVSLLTAILLGFLTVHVVDEVEVEMRGCFLGIFLVVLVLVFAALFLGRAGDVLLGRLPASAAGSLREVGALFSYTFRFMAPLVLVGGVVLLLVQDQAAASALVPVYLGNLLTGLLALGTFGAVQGDSNPFVDPFADGGAQKGSEYQFAWDVMGAWSVLLFLVMVVLVVVLAASVGVRRPRLAAPDLTRVWQLPVLAWVVALVFLHLLAPVSLSAKVLGARQESSVTASWWSSLTFALLVTAVSVLAEYVPAIMYNLSQPLLRLCAGSAATSRWLAGPGVAVPAGAVAGGVAGGFTTTPQGSVIGAAAGDFPASQTGGFPVAPGGGAPVAPPEGFMAAPDAGAAAAGGYQASQTGGLPVAQPGQALPAPAPLDPAARKRLKVIGAGFGVLVLLVAVGVGAVAFLNSSRTPQATVQSYLQLVAEGKASEANAVVDPGVPNDQRLLLTDEVLGAAKSRIVVDEVRELKGKGDVRTVKATVSLDDKSHELTIEVHKGPKDYGLLNTWKIDTPAVQQVTLSAMGLQQVVVSGATLDFPEKKDVGYSSVEQYAYFGIYDLALPEGYSTYLEPVNRTLLVEPVTSLGFGGNQAKTVVTVQPTSKLEELAQKAVEAAAESCVKPENRKDEECPWLIRTFDLQSLEVKETGSDLSIEEDMSFSGGPVTFKYQEKVTSWRPNPKFKETKYKMKGKITFPDGAEPRIEVTGSSEYYGF